ncbi:MAG: hypothetical protein DWQ35_13720 [Planctomycetota bacterium]|nr:MAG: hypothetical protein DWQ35_13720 [Planctomycetota bacterium]REK25998.1 MAG: hypothetical protein DWQ42_10240 [Planctomycetota bacterium]REK46887.1 MAG: hypothetical protein DWQ46_05165 [Planctomycetota bacterium]
MSIRSRWEFCVQHCEEVAENFIREFFSDNNRTVFLITAAGFDPRSCEIPDRLLAAGHERIHGLVLREERLEGLELMPLADEHASKLTGSSDNFVVERVPLFADDGAVVGGRHVATLLSQRDLAQYTDIVVDFSALSIGIAFPAVRYLLEAIDSGAAATLPNLHIAVIDEPWTDSEIQSIASNKAAPIHGFSGVSGIDRAQDSARLWMPQLGRGQDLHAVLELIHQAVRPHAVCPILPFPSTDIRFTDELIWRFRTELENTWRVDDRDVVFAHENQPLDLYRSVLRIHEVRERVFCDVGGSMTVLSPTGRKMLAIGAMLAAIEKDFPVMHVESVGYSVDLDRLNAARDGKKGRLAHLWIAGEAYLGSREA